MNEITDKDILELWDENERYMGEQAALHVTCEQLGISLDKAMSILLKNSKKGNKK